LSRSRIHHYKSHSFTYRYFTNTNYRVNKNNKTTENTFTEQNESDETFVPGFSSPAHHERVQASRRNPHFYAKTSTSTTTPSTLDSSTSTPITQSSSPPPPPNTPPPSTLSPSYSTSSYPGEEEAMPDYDETNFNPNKFPSKYATTSGCIRAVYLSRHIDVLKIFQKQYGSSTDTNIQMPIINKNSVILVIPSHTRGNETLHPSPTTSPTTSSPSQTASPTNITPTGGYVDPLNDSDVGYAVFLDFGAAIFFGLDESEESKILATVDEFCTDRITGTLRQENMMYEEVPTLNKWHEYDRTRDMITLQKIDLNTVRVVAGVIGQTVALDHYEREADALLDVFQELNKTIAKSQGKY
jgi:uncharacterized Rmd1/YagE family protein